MNILIILAHPNPESFNHAIAHTCKNSLKKIGHSVVLHDLYKEKFDPLLFAEEFPKEALLNETIQQHCTDLINADGIIIVHPNWWGQPPAILKGWIDRVIRPGIAYEFEEGDNGEGTPIGLLKAEKALVFNTSNTSEFRETNIFKDPLEFIWNNCIFDLCGIKQFKRKMFRIVVTSNLKKRQEWLTEVEDTINQHFN